MKKFNGLIFTLILIFLISFLSSWMFIPSPSPQWDASTPLHEVLFAFGETVPTHYVESPSELLIKQGEELFKEGRTFSPEGKKSAYISKFYVCTDCHNTVQEDPDLTKSDPETRLIYAYENGLPFLQGTTMKGAANRESWYNGDYEKKYGDLVKPARNSLAGATQLCAQECSQGRMLEDWEIEAIMAYFWSISFTLEDLGLSEEMLSTLENARKDPNSADRNALISELKASYLRASPATFSEPPEDQLIGYKEVIEGNPDNGKLIYDLACKNCHGPNGVSRYLLDDSEYTFKKLYRNIPKKSKHSIYQIIRHGTYAQPGARPYMPLYTLERMNHQQVEDLRAYIENRAL